jgi:hypothetical protein
MEAYARTNSAVSQHKMEECFCEDTDIKEGSVLRNAGHFLANEINILFRLQ